MRNAGLASPVAAMRGGDCPKDAGALSKEGPFQLRRGPKTKVLPLLQVFPVSVGACVNETSEMGAAACSGRMVAGRGRVFGPVQTILARAARLFQADGGAAVPSATTIHAPRLRVWQDVLSGPATLDRDCKRKTL